MHGGQRRPWQDSGANLTPPALMVGNEDSPSSTMTHRQVACPDCDALLLVPEADGAVFHCPQCHGVILRRMAPRFDIALACYLAAATSFAIANCFAILRISTQGIQSEVTLDGAVYALYQQGMPAVAALVALTIIAVPTAEMICSIVMLLTLQSSPTHCHLARFAQWRRRLRPWNMVEILMLGVLVALVKLNTLATVILGVGVWALAAFMLTHAAGSHAFDSRDLWDELPVRTA